MEKLRRTQIYLPSGLSTALDRLARGRGTSRAELLRQAARETGVVITVEDHWPEGGVGEAVLAALATSDPMPQVRILGVQEMPGSGTPDELLDAAGISAKHIAIAVRELVSARGPTRVSIR